MKRKISLFVALILSIVLAALINSDSTVEAQQGGRRLNYDTGVVTLGPNQILRVTVNVISGNNNAGVQFRRINYEQEACNGGVCRLTGDFDGDGDVDGADFLISANEAVSIDIPSSAFGVRAVVTSNKPVRVNAQIIDATTGEVQSIIAILIAL